MTDYCKECGQWKPIYNCVKCGEKLQYIPQPRIFNALYLCDKCAKEEGFGEPGYRSISLDRGFEILGLK